MLSRFTVNGTVAFGFGPGTIAFRVIAGGVQILAVGHRSDIYR